jgi:hypothetical protein
MDCPSCGGTGEVTQEEYDRIISGCYCERGLMCGICTGNGKDITYGSGF